MTESEKLSADNLIWTGAWNSSDTYAPNDLVMYVPNHNVYICIATASGSSQSPLNTTYWHLFLPRGVTGTSGTMISAPYPISTRASWQSVFYSAVMILFIIIFVFLLMR